MLGAWITITRSSCLTPRPIRFSRNATVRMPAAGVRWATAPLHLCGAACHRQRRRLGVRVLHGDEDGAWAMPSRRQRASLDDQYGKLEANSMSRFAPTATARRIDISPDAIQVSKVHQPRLEILTREECFQLLRGAVVGRIAYVADGMATIIPVNFALFDGDIVFCTANGSTLSWLSMRGRLAFEADESRPADHEGWSVLIRGVAREVTNPDDSRSSVAATCVPGCGRRTSTGCGSASTRCQAEHSVVPQPPAEAGERDAAGAMRIRTAPPHAYMVRARR